MRGEPGAPSQLGATFDGDGVNFALFSAHATGVELCLFDNPHDQVERARVPLSERTNLVWHGYVAGLKPGQLYGYRVSGPWAPETGLHFNPAKLLLDPYARQLGRSLVWHPSLLGAIEAGAAGGSPDRTDSAPFAPLAAVPEAPETSSFDWRSDRRPSTPWEDTVIYELHVKGFSALNPSVPADLRGTFLGLASASSIRHLKELGVTAVELLPVQLHADERRLREIGLVNYWGYNTLGYFLADERFATGASPGRAAAEFKTMVRALHEAGLEVILDVVYNHTAEGGALGPTLSYRGIDNQSYYRLDPDNPERYLNLAGTGNTLDLGSPVVLRLVMDSLRYWVDEMRVDGFRFDLASVLARESDGFDPAAGFLRAIQQDPVLSAVKLIAEPWDATAEGYALGRFPPGWSEWNDRYRNTVRRFWTGRSHALADLPTRIAGSSDLFEPAGRHPTASINMVTSHDGFTLADLVSYDERHNDANGEANADGERENFSWNSGVEGPTDDPGIRALRERRRRSLLLTLFTSLGVPMISGGDEMGRTQAGNNNAYCHDSPATWTPWALDADGESFLGFVQSLTALRKSQPVLRRRRFLAGRAGGAADVLWIGPSGREMTDVDWRGSGQTLAVLFDGDAVPDSTGAGQRVAGDTLLVILSAEAGSVEFTLPAHRPNHEWQVVIDTAGPAAARGQQAAGDRLALVPHSAMVLRAVPGE
jgi:glycogen operon protein